MPVQLAADCGASCSDAHSLIINAYYDYKRSLSVQFRYLDFEVQIFEYFRSFIFLQADGFPSN